MVIVLPDPSEFIHAIRQIYPQLAIDDVHFNQDGQYNDVLIVNDEWLFRFAKFAEGEETLRREIAILNKIQEYITLPIPKPLFQHLGNDTVARSFMGYRMLSGQPLWLEDFQSIHDPAALERMAHQLGTFLRELHTIPITYLQSLNLPVADQLAEWSDLYERIQNRLFSHMRAEARRTVTAHFENYFANTEAYHYTPVLRHGDFGTGNLLYDPTTLTMSGVIDFGATTLGDPAIDFAGLFSFGEDFCHHCYAVYPELEKMLGRVQFYRGTFALQEALYGVENGDIEAFASGIAEYK